MYQLAISLLMAATALLGQVQNTPNAPAELRAEAISIATQAIAYAETTLGQNVGTVQSGSGSATTGAVGYSSGPDNSGLGSTTGIDDSGVTGELSGTVIGSGQLSQATQATVPLTCKFIFGRPDTYYGQPVVFLAWSSTGNGNLDLEPSVGPVASTSVGNYNGANQLMLSVATEPTSVDPAVYTITDTSQDGTASTTCSVYVQ